MPYADPEKQRAYRREWYNKRRDDWVRRNGPCVQCGSNDGLEVDHIERQSKVSHRVWSWSLERRSAELAKCQVLCRACHRAKTSAENSRPVVHGRRTTYDRRGCRCDPCREAKNGYQRQFRPSSVDIPAQRTG